MFSNRTKMKTEKTAIQFFKEIEKEQEKYKLINGLFIVKYINEDISIFVGDFLKRNSALNQSKINKVLIFISDNPQQFNKRNKTTLTRLLWKKLNINFEEEDIKQILI